MDNLLYKYFNKNYRLTVSTYSSYKLYDKINDVDVGLKTVLLSMEKIFSVTQDKISEVFDKWSDEQSKLINNDSLTTGKTITLTPSDINKILGPAFTKEENDIVFAPYLPMTVVEQI